MKQTPLSIFGPNLRDQSKGQFVVHAKGCADCGKLKNENHMPLLASSFEEVAKELYGDMINEGSCDVATAMGEVHFAPCVKF